MNSPGGCLRPTTTSLLDRLFRDTPGEIADLASTLVHETNHVIPPEAAVILAVKFIGIRTYEPEMYEYAAAWNMSTSRLVDMELASLRVINWNIARFWNSDV